MQRVIWEISSGKVSEQLITFLAKEMRNVQTGAKRYSTNYCRRHE